jgi:alpha-ketoglutarate-dependent taurine dioxygenase
VVAASQGGETPLADSADVLDDLPVAMRDELAERGLLYRRHFVAGVDVPWQRFFGTSDRRAVDEQCRVQGIRAVWRTDGSLCIETRRPSVVCHPSTGRRTFFNQILLHHAHCLDPEVREALALGLPGGEMPRDVRFGDGLPIPNDWIDRILEAYSRVAIAFSWKPGDIVICDNVTVAHARRPYAGARRHRVVLSQFHKCEDNP